MAKVKNPFSSERTILGYSGRGIAAALRVAIPLLTGEQPAPSGVMVRSQIIKANGEPVNVDYMMRRTGDSWLISDIYLDGAISEVATRRSEFATILKSQGIDGLIWSRAARRSKEVGFAMDSPLEGDGFEPVSEPESALVPTERAKYIRGARGEQVLVAGASHGPPREAARSTFRGLKIRP